MVGAGEWMVSGSVIVDDEGKIMLREKNGETRSSGHVVPHLHIISLSFDCVSTEEYFCTLYRSERVVCPSDDRSAESKHFVKNMEWKQPVNKGPESPRSRGKEQLDCILNQLGGE